MERFIQAGNTIWWFGMGAVLIIGGVVLLLSLFDRRKENRAEQAEWRHEIDQHLAELYKITDDLRERELQRARREIRGRERKADAERKRHEAAQNTLVSLNEDQIEFMTNVTETINGL